MLENKHSDIVIIQVICRMWPLYRLLVVQVCEALCTRGLGKLLHRRPVLDVGLYLTKHYIDDILHSNVFHSKVILYAETFQDFEDIYILFQKYRKNRLTNKIMYPCLLCTFRRIQRRGLYIHHALYAVLGIFTSITCVRFSKDVSD